MRVDIDASVSLPSSPVFPDQSEQARCEGEWCFLEG